MMNYFQNLLGNYQFNASHLAIGAGVLVVLYFIWSFMKGDESSVPGPASTEGPDAEQAHQTLPPMPESEAPAPVPAHGVVAEHGEVQQVNQTAGGAAGRTLVLYYAPWCTYCKNLMPTWDALSQKYGDQMQKVDCEQFPEESEKQDIKVFPTMILFVDGKPAQVVEGVKDAAGIEQMLQ